MSSGIASHSAFYYHCYLCFNTGFTGLTCETEILECASNPCNFGGTCIDLINDFQCVCAEGFIGKTCQAVIRLCPTEKPCGDRGVCVDKPTGGEF